MEAGTASPADGAHGDDRAVGRAADRTSASDATESVSGAGADAASSGQVRSAAGPEACASGEAEAGSRRQGAARDAADGAQARHRAEFAGQVPPNGEGGPRSGDETETDTGAPTARREDAAGTTSSTDSGASADAEGATERVLDAGSRAAPHGAAEAEASSGGTPRSGAESGPGPKSLTGGTARTEPGSAGSADAEGEPALEDGDSPAASADRAKADDADKTVSASRVGDKPGTDETIETGEFGENAGPGPSDKAGGPAAVVSGKVKDRAAADSGSTPGEAKPAATEDKPDTPAASEADADGTDRVETSSKPEKAEPKAKNKPDAPAAGEADGTNGAETDGESEKAESTAKDKPDAPAAEATGKVQDPADDEAEPGGTKGAETRSKSGKAETAAKGTPAGEAASASRSGGTAGSASEGDGEAGVSAGPEASDGVRPGTGGVAEPESPAQGEAPAEGDADARAEADGASAGSESRATDGAGKARGSAGFEGEGKASAGGSGGDAAKPKGAAAAKSPAASKTKAGSGDGAVRSGAVAQGSSGGSVKVAVPAPGPASVAGKADGGVRDQGDASGAEPAGAEVRGAGVRRVAREVVRRPVALAGAVLALLVVVFLVVQMVRPLPEPELKVRKAAATVTVPGGRFAIPWPGKGQGAVMVAGGGTIGTFGAEKPVPTASVAKIMTAYVILREHPLAKGERGPRITIDAKTVTDGTAEDESRVEGLQEGQSFSELDMLRMLMIPSGNNIARMLARWDSGPKGEAAFVRKMNDAAKALGMRNTTYTDPSGLGRGTVSTAVDQLKLADAVMKSDAFRSVVSMVGADIPGAGHIDNNNAPLLTAGLGVEGIKTGSNTPAGGTLSWAARATVDGKERLVLGTMMDQHVTGPDPNGANSLALVLENSRKVVAAVRKGLTTGTAVRKGQVVGHVDDGFGGRTPVVAAKDLIVVGLPGQRVRVAFRDGGRALARTAGRGTVVGELTASTVDGSAAGKVPVVLKSALKEPSFGTRITRVG
ncbi:D-alanyl-D-alanine carboxypeptidase [Streptomyces sp. NPDC021100]|uniref:D-alanyl-D-alanine carboxypeptidase n=1 Tax=Streptomyces sp. NPDC021100 TaxID=3365114 RepID=UPI003794826D